MDLKQLFEKIYNGEITENDVIVESVKDYNEEYENYILNDEFDFWKYDGDGLLSLSFFKNDNNKDYKTSYSIISKEEFERKIDKINKQKKIKSLEYELKKLKGELDDK